MLIMRVAKVKDGKIKEVTIINDSAYVPGGDAISISSEKNNTDYVQGDTTSIPLEKLEVFNQECNDSILNALEIKKIEKNKMLIKRDDLIKFLIEHGFLKEEYGLKTVEKVKGHCGGCSCIDCGQFNDDCVCTHNMWVEFIKQNEKMINDEQKFEDLNGKAPDIIDGISSEDFVAQLRSDWL